MYQYPGMYQQPVIQPVIQPVVIDQPTAQTPQQPEIVVINSKPSGNAHGGITVAFVLIILIIVTIMFTQTKQ
jgi:hypothetical protein